VSGKNGGTIVLRLDDEHGPVIGRLEMKGTGTSDTFMEMSCKVKNAKGVHDLPVFREAYRLGHDEI